MIFFAFLFFNSLIIDFPIPLDPPVTTQVEFNGLNPILLAYVSKSFIDFSYFVYKEYSILVKMLINNKNYKTIWYNKKLQAVQIIDQTKLPFDLDILTLKSLNDIIKAITQNCKMEKRVFIRSRHE